MFHKHYHTHHFEKLHWILQDARNFKSYKHSETKARINQKKTNYECAGELGCLKERVNASPFVLRRPKHPTSKTQRCNTQQGAREFRYIFKRYIPLIGNIT